MAMKRPVIAVDIDEVLAQFVPAVARFHNYNYETSLTIDDFHSYEFYQVWGGTKEESIDKMNAFFSSHHFSEGVDPMPKALGVLKKLKSDFDLHLVTARQFKVEQPTRQWIKKFFPDLFTDIHFGNHFTVGEKTRTKADMCLDIGAKLLIDDSYTYATQCAKAGIPIILFGDYAWNRGPARAGAGADQAGSDRDGGEGESGRIHRASNWNQVEGLIHKLFNIFYGPAGTASTCDSATVGSSSMTATSSISSTSAGQLVAALSTEVREAGGYTTSSADRTSPSASTSTSTFAKPAILNSAPSPPSSQPLTTRSIPESQLPSRPQSQPESGSGSGSESNPRILMAAIQMCSTNDKEANLRATVKLVEEAAAKGARFISLPECSAFMGSGPTDTVAASESLDGPYVASLKALASKLRIWLSVGGFPEKMIDTSSPGTSGGSSSNVGKVGNLHFVISPEGQVVSPVYRKIHLFDSPLAGLTESKSTVAGEALSVVDAGFARLGLTVCYDLRFPELYGRLCRPPPRLAVPTARSPGTGTRSETISTVSSGSSSGVVTTARRDEAAVEVELEGGLGAEIVLVPAAFTVKTGRAHWEVLLRARAIENQCYIVAAAQVGRHNEKRESYGGTLIIDPWGEVVARCPSIDDLSATTTAPAAATATITAAAAATAATANVTPSAEGLVAGVSGSIPVDVATNTTRAIEEKGGREEYRGSSSSSSSASSICYAVFDRSLLQRTRDSMPVQSHRRPDIYYAPAAASAAAAAATAAAAAAGPSNSHL